MFDYVVVDTAPAFDEQTLTTLEETDECVIIATLDVPTLKNVKVALDTLEMLNIGRGHRHLLLNRADDAVGIDAQKVESILGMDISTQITTSIDIAASTNSGVPILTASPTTRPARPSATWRPCSPGTPPTPHQIRSPAATPSTTSGRSPHVPDQEVRR